jgi:hypothetical protein
MVNTQRIDTDKFFNRVLLVTAFLTALFTTVHAADINLALGKSATQSSTPEICFIGNTDSIVTKSICTAIGAIVDNDLIDIFCTTYNAIIFF